ncbi:MAG: hypothetical protein AAB298_08230, partial [Pseudomonadota bacterium]
MSDKQRMTISWCRKPESEHPNTFPAKPIPMRLAGFSTSSSFLQIIEKFRRRFRAGHEQVIACAGAGDVQQVAFGVVDFV